MGLLARVASWFGKAGTSSASDAALWADTGYSSPSVTGIRINQYTALNSSAVLAVTTMLAEDVAKLPWSVFRHADDKSRTEARDHFLYDLLQEPNAWMNGLEFREMLQVGLILRGNGYAAIKRDGRGRPVALYPWNPDRVLQWMASSGHIFYRLTAHNIHEQALLNDLAPQLSGSQQLLPSDDMLHIRGFSLDGLMGMSRIALAREAIALGLSQEQQAARWMGQGAKPSGMLTTDQKLTPDAAKRLADDFKQNVSGLQNSGKIIVGEQGLKFQPFTMTSADLEFIASRQFQLQDVARIFRIPPHMIGELSRSTNNNIAQMAQEYINFTLTGYTNRWSHKLSSTFGLRQAGLSVMFDYRDLTTADMTSRINNWRVAIMSMMATPNEARLDLNWPRSDDPGADELHFPANMAAAGSQSSGTAPDGAGRPADDTADPVKAIDIEERQRLFAGQIGDAVIEGMRLASPADRTQALADDLARELAELRGELAAGQREVADISASALAGMKEIATAAATPRDINIALTMPATTTRKTITTRQNEAGDYIAEVVEAKD
jgi:HK97 family phage portal protein